MARERPTASHVQQMLSDVDAPTAEGLVSGGAAPGPDSALSPAQMRALRRSDRLTSAECLAYRRRIEPRAPEAGRPPA